MVGGHLLQQLPEFPDYARFVALTRRAIAPQPRLDARIVNFDALTPADCAGADVVFCALGTTIKKAGSQGAFRRVDFGYVKALADSSHAAGAQQFVIVSSVGADPESRNFYLRVKGEAEQAITALPFTAVHIFRPSLLLGERSESRTGEALGRALMPVINPLLIGGLRNYRAVRAAQVARAMLAAPLRGVPGVHTYEYDQITAPFGR